MTYIDFSKAAASSEGNALLSFLNSVLTGRSSLSVLLRMALIPLLMGLATFASFAASVATAVKSPGVKK